MINSCCIIPARGGSKRIPKKNIKHFLGKPIIAYSIEAALHSGLFSDVIVSTDDLEIAEIAQEYGAMVPFMRKPETADDFATLADVVTEVLENEKYRNVDSHFAVVLATAPFLTAQNLTDAYSQLSESSADSIVSVVEYNYPIYKSLRVDNDGFIGLNFPEYFRVRSQDMPIVYHDAAQFYFNSREVFMKNKRLISGNCLPFLINKHQYEDIDTLEDWLNAEMKYEILHKV